MTYGTVDYQKAPCWVCDEPTNAQRNLRMCDSCLHNVGIRGRRYNTWRTKGASHFIIMTWLVEPTCWICGEFIDLRIRDYHEMSAAIDHDHACCGHAKSCPRCIRGLAHKVCNVRLGGLENLLRGIGADEFARVLSAIGG